MTTKQKVWIVSPRGLSSAIRVCAPDIPTAIQKCIGWGISEETEIESVTAGMDVLVVSE